MNESSKNVQRRPSVIFSLVLTLAVLASGAALYWSYNLQHRLERSQALLASAAQQNDKLALDLDATNARLSVTSETLGQSVGLTQHELELRANDLLLREHAETARLAREEAQQKSQIGQVTGQVSTVKTDVGSVKDDVGQTKNELQSASTQLQNVTGDLGVHGGLIASNSRELEALKRKTDRNYFDFVLYQGGAPATVATIRLQLKKTDPKHSRYTLMVIADDKKIEKKDKNLNEPVEFYTGKNNQLYQLVINKIDGQHVAGYLTTPKATGSQQNADEGVRTPVPIVASSAPGPSGE